MFEIGDGLREARIRRGLSLKEAEEATKIRCKYLQALEDDDFEVIPGPTFVKGFMRTYAQFLGLDADLLLDEYRSRHEPRQEIGYSPRKPVARARDRAPRRQSNLVLVGVVALAVLLLLYWVGWGRSEPTAVLDPAAVEATTTTQIAGLQQTTLLQGETTGEPAGTGEATTTSLASTGGRLAIEIRAARGRCWLLVKQDSATGKVLYSGTLEKGDTVTFAEGRAYWINVGSPASLDVVVNGQQVPVPEPYGDFLVSAAGLQRVP